jgi:hypothetical protein
MSMPALRQHSRSGSISSSLSHHHHQLSASGIPYTVAQGLNGVGRLGHHHLLHLPHGRHVRNDSQGSSGAGSGGSGGNTGNGADAPSAVSLRNPAEFMIHALFVEFAAAAEGKLTWVMKQPMVDIMASY